MSQNYDTTDCATKSPSSRSTLESDSCCSPVRTNISTHPFDGPGVSKAQHGYSSVLASDLTRNTIFCEEDYDSGVALSGSTTISDTSISESGKSVFRDKNQSSLPDDKCDQSQISNIGKNFKAKLCLGDGGSKLTPVESRHGSKFCDVGEDLFNWDLIFQQDEDGDTQLHIAAMLDTQLDFALSVVNLCITAQCLDLQNDLLQTVLHLAVIMRRTQLVQALASRGATLFICDQNGNTPLHLACQTGYTDAVHVLTQKYCTQSEKLALQRIIHHRNYEGLTCCHLAAKSSAPDNLFHLIQDCGADINVQEGKRGMTVLHTAAESNNRTLVAFLVEFPNINLNQLTYDGWTALDLAAGRRLEDIQMELQKAGARRSSEEETDTFSSDELSEEEIIDLEIFQCRTIPDRGCNKRRSTESTQEMKDCRRNLH